ncbi:MAG: oxidative damage protection protein [Thiotrichales bacterium]|jgi:Fe-S cluster biosynthesis and repair protein YggX|nr:oxidative damage protection protein [Thiotrichales bacterium]MBT3613426.1 oxidative damage protection protein [Thiotrichales bacterium]MBT3752245.1 oxidative damage protection protein [Thiotrichales bacterium]MBT3836950.1 oxidative damage protection protein [Thiotrichales bacterium]MBT4261594.1 oxidative damage protection protein [Thiotrichales bacterium]
MGRLVECVKLGREAEGLERAPYPGDIGERIFNHISIEGWKQWQQQQTILINENRLNMAESKARKFLEEQMEEFLFN